jgi:four helix bundle protein
MPPEEKYELGSQIRRSSNSSPANLAEKHADRHISLTNSLTMSSLPLTPEP